MDSDRWQRVWEVFHLAAEVEAEARQEVLASECGADQELRLEVESLLASFDQPEDFLDHPEVLAVGPEGAKLEGERVGPYEVLRRLGEGGMGAVYRARRADDEFDREVAIKVLRGGLGSEEMERRFRLERQILAELDHPNIARLFDGGSTSDGQLYLVLELIEGVPIDDYCDQAELGLEDRLRLFLSVCDAVEYAHRRLVVHRDLKPSNILVAEDGVPKLLDFGIAKLLSEDSRATATRIMTPGYASPEQIRGEPAHTASDAYSLGVLLYELLVGRSPYQSDTETPFELAREILEEEPVRPSRALHGAETAAAGTSDGTGGAGGSREPRRLVGDLDTIVLKSLRKDPAERYADVGRLAADLRSHLDGRPISARPDTVGYRVGKFVRRNRIGVAVAAMVLLLLVGATVVTSVLALRLSQALAGAEREREKAERVAGFLTELFETPDPIAQLGEEISTREILDRGAGRIRSELDGQPEVQADLMMVMGLAYQNLGHAEPALGLYTDSLALRRGLFGTGHPEVAASLLRIGIAQRVLGEAEQAVETLTEVVDARRELSSGEDAELAQALDELGVAFFFAGDYEQAAKTHRQALTIRRRLFGESNETATSLDHLALSVARLGQLEEAEPLFRESLAMSRATLPDEHPDLATIMMNLAVNLYSLGKAEEAEAFFLDALERRRRFYGERHPEVAITLNNFSNLLRDTGRFGEAESVIREALDITLEFRGPDHPEVASRFNSLALILGRQGRQDESLEALSRAMAIRLESQGADHPDTAIATYNHAVAVRRTGDLKAAAAALRLALERFRGAFGDEHRYTAAGLGGLATVLVQTGEPEVAEPLLREALAIHQATLPEGHPGIALTRLQLGNCLLKLERLDEAERVLLQALRVYEATEGGREAETRSALSQLIKVNESLGREEEAAAYRARLEELKPAG